jgi:hypothetical protein
MLGAQIDLECRPVDRELESAGTLSRFAHIAEDLNDHLTRHAPTS